MEISEELKLKKILVVDDAASLRNITKSVLRNAGFVNIYDAQDGKEAYTIIVKIKIDLVLCDWNMPVMNGLELFKLVKKSDLYEMGFIMLTAETEGGKVKEALAAGITEYMIKPFTSEVLLNKVLKNLE